MNRVQWYPQCRRELREEFLEKLIDLRNEEKITLWLDEDENGKIFYDIREIEKENTGA